MAIYVGTASSSAIHSTSVGIGTTNTAGRNAGVGTASGTMVFNTDSFALQVFDGTVWRKAAGEAIAATGGSTDTSGRAGFTVHTFTSSASSSLP